MAYEELANLLYHVGKDPSRLIFEDELTGVNNRRFLHNYFEYKVSWTDLLGHPLSVLMMDVDEFKQINDKQGHESGDQALMWVSRILREIGGDKGLPIRYAGDEFVLLLPETTKTEALAVAERLVARIRQEPCLIHDGKESLRLTLSIGVATAPDDADSAKTLLQKADTALYYVKKSGRDGLANVAKLDPQKVAAKEALHQLEASNIAGRGLQLIEVAEGFKKFSRGENQFLVIRGASGMGKTTFLEIIRRNLAQSEVSVAKITASQQEMFHPYVLVTHLLGALLSLRPDKGAGLLAALSAEESRCLDQLLPQVGLRSEGQTAEAEKSQRETLCSTIVQLVPRILDSRPLILLVDDLQFADEATLLVLRLILDAHTIPLFVCGTALDPADLQVAGERVPLARFCSDEKDALGIKMIDLTALTAADIAVHLKGIFPQLSLPDTVATELEHVTRGNPQFLAELIRKLVHDQKVALIGQRWVIEAFEAGYLPKSLEEIVTQKISKLDQEDQHLLAQASTFGEDVSLSYLTGSSHAKEAEILDFVDKAVDQGLLRSDFHHNDEAIRFRGKGIQDLTYSGIPADRKEAIHEQIADYQEQLYKSGLLASAVSLVYHFTRSNAPHKAGRYELMQAERDQTIFNATEAQDYSSDPPDSPLDQTTATQIPAVLRLFLTAVRNIQLYPPQSKAIVTIAQQLTQTLNHILAASPRLNLTQNKGVLQVNGQKLQGLEVKSIGGSFVELLTRVELEGVAFHRGFSDQELNLAVEGLGRVERKMIDRRFWQRFCVEHGLRHITIKQVRYKERVESSVQPACAPLAEEKLEPHHLPLVHDILRTFLSAARNIRLYPSSSKTVTNAIAQLGAALTQGLQRSPTLTFACVSNGLMVNGEKADTTTFKSVAEGFLQFLPSIGLTSLTFVRPLSTDELLRFVEILAQPPADGAANAGWKHSLRQHGFSSILFDHRLYEVRDAITTGTPGTHHGPGEPEKELHSIPVLETVATTEDSSDKSRQSLTELAMTGQTDHIRMRLTDLLDRYNTRPLGDRRQAIELCRSTIDRLPMGSQLAFAQLVVDPLLRAFDEETDQNLFSEIVRLLHGRAIAAIQLGDHPLAARIFLHLHDTLRQDRFRQPRDRAAPKDSRMTILLKVLNDKLDGMTQQLLVEDFTSPDTARQQRAAQVLGALGKVSAITLMEILKKSDDLRIRQRAATLLKEQGPEAAALLKRELVLEISAQERCRMLDVADLVTHDLVSEFAYLLDRGEAQVHEAAFRLAERLNDTLLVEQLTEFAKHTEPDLAVAAIKCLGRLKVTASAGMLIVLLESSSDPDRIVACCRALGQIADPTSIAPLARFLPRPRGLFHFGKVWNPLIRAMAAFALGQMSHPDAAKVLSVYVEDDDPRVRKIARTRNPVIARTGPLP